MSLTQAKLERKQVPDMTVKKVKGQTSVNKS